MEAVSSVALSHEEGCTCNTCKAASGNRHALAAVLNSLSHPSLQMDSFLNPDGVKWTIHGKEGCNGKPCAFHNPTNHHMNSWPLDLNKEKNLLFERVCKHGVRHPDPDSYNYLSSLEPSKSAELMNHDCDNCCKSHR